MGAGQALHLSLDVMSGPEVCSVEWDWVGCTCWGWDIVVVGNGLFYSHVAACGHPNMQEVCLHDIIQYRAVPFLC